MDHVIYYLVPTILAIWTGISVYVVRKEVHLPAPPVRIRKSYRRFMSVR